MKALVVYYSRTGNTRKVGQEIARQLKADTEEIISVMDRGGPLGFLRSGREAQKKILAEIKPVKKDPSKYDLVVIGTPIWASNMSSPVRTYLSMHKFKKTAYFLTGGGTSGKTFEDMGRITGKKTAAVLAVTDKEIKEESYSEKVKEFVGKLK
jgi:flavodoxin